MQSLRVKLGGSRFPKTKRFNRWGTWSYMQHLKLETKPLTWHFLFSNEYPQESGGDEISSITVCVTDTELTSFLLASCQIYKRGPYNRHWPPHEEQRGKTSAKDLYLITLHLSSVLKQAIKQEIWKWIYVVNRREKETVGCVQIFPVSFLFILKLLSLNQT